MVYGGRREGYIVKMRDTEWIGYMLPEDRVGGIHVWYKMAGEVAGYVAEEGGHEWPIGVQEGSRPTWIAVVAHCCMVCHVSGEVAWR